MVARGRREGIVMGRGLPLPMGGIGCSFFGMASELVGHEIALPDTDIAH